MKTTIAAFLFWAPRILGLLIAAFLALFALDAFDGRPMNQVVPALTMHLIPSLLVLAIVAIAWRREWAGALGFLALAVAYGAMVKWRLDWMAVIAGPLVVVAVLFLVAGRYGEAVAK